MFPISVWPQVAEILGERASAPFAGGLWHFCTRGTVWLGFALPVGVYLIIVAAISSWVFHRFVIHRDRKAFMIAFVIVGALLADTPFAVLLIVGFEVYRAHRCRLIEQQEIRARMPVIDQMMVRAMSAIALGFMIIAGYNIHTCGIDEYVVGYARKALSDVKVGHWISPIDNYRAATIVRDFAKGMAGELREGKWCFSDGSCDDGAGVYAAREGKRVVFLPATNLDEANRRAIIAKLDGYEERAAIVEGASALLKTWLDSNSKQLKECMVQTWFSAWKSRQLAIPRPGCFLADCSDKRTEDIDNLAAKRIAEQIFSFYQSGGEIDNLEETLKRRFLAVQWRLSRIARMRGEWYDNQGKPDKAKAEMEFSDKLDVVNPQAQEAFHRLDMIQMATSCAISPREGLEFALRAANFPLAHQLAKSILLSEPENAKANFAAGMNYLMLGNLALAEEHLKIVLKTRPNDPAVLNNIAIILRKQGRKTEALEYAKRAQAIDPEAGEIKATIRSLEVGE